MKRLVLLLVLNSIIVLFFSMNASARPPYGDPWWCDHLDEIPLGKPYPESCSIDEDDDEGGGDIPLDKYITRVFNEPMTIEAYTQLIASENSVAQPSTQLSKSNQEPDLIDEELASSSIPAACYEGDDADGDGIKDADEGSHTKGKWIADYPYIESGISGFFDASMVIKQSNNTVSTVNFEQVSINQYTRTLTTTDTLEFKRNMKLNNGEGWNPFKWIKNIFGKLASDDKTTFGLSFKFSFEQDYNKKVVDNVINHWKKTATETIEKNQVDTISYDANAGKVSALMYIKNTGQPGANIEVSGIRFAAVAYDPKSGNGWVFGDKSLKHGEKIVLGTSSSNNSHEEVMTFDGINTHQFLTAMNGGYTFSIIPLKGHDGVIKQGSSESYRDRMNTIDQHTVNLKVHYPNGQSKAMKVSRYNRFGNCIRINGVLENAFGLGNISYTVNANGKSVIESIYEYKRKNTHADFDDLSTQQQNDYGKWIVAFQPGEENSHLTNWDIQTTIVKPGDSIYLYYLTKDDMIKPTTNEYDFYDDDIGIIPEGECPADSDRVEIFMNDENEYGFNQNSQTGWIGAIESGIDTKIIACRVDGDYFKPLTKVNVKDYHFAVLQLDEKCPLGATSVTRKIMNNGYTMSSIRYTNYNNWVSGDIAPMSQTSSATTLKFCVFGVHGDSGHLTGIEPMYRFPDLGIPYGVFASDYLWDKVKLETGGIISSGEYFSNGHTLETPSALVTEDVKRFILPVNTRNYLTIFKTAKVRE